jgi:hypothetical protein
MIKARFGERLRSKTRTAQVNELLLKVLCNNLCMIVQCVFKMGIEPVFWPDDFSGESTNDPKLPDKSFFGDLSGKAA